MSAIGTNAHDHTAYVTSAVRKAEERCAKTGLCLTPVRRRSLEISLKEHRA